MTVLVVLLALAAVAVVVVCLSPLRGVLAAVPVVAAHPALTVGITAALAAAVLAIGAVVVVRSVRASGGRLLVMMPPRTGPPAAT